MTRGPIRLKRVKAHKSEKGIEGLITTQINRQTARNLEFVICKGEKQVAKHGSCYRKKSSASEADTRCSLMLRFNAEADVSVCT